MTPPTGNRRPILAGFFRRLAVLRRCPASPPPGTRRGAVSLAGLAPQIREDLATGRKESDTWRLLYGFADDFRGSSTEGKRWLIGDEPALTGRRGLDAALAGMAEFFAGEAGLPVPAWVNGESRVAVPWYFVASSTWQHAYVLARTPAAFKAHGVFIAREVFDRA
jgi:hypothetical protein